MLARWSPFNGGIARSVSSMPAFDELFREADNLLSGAWFGDVALPGDRFVAAAHVPPADVSETEAELQVKLDLPGHDPKSLQVRFEGDTLTVQSERRREGPPERPGYLRAERSFGVFSRSFVLPNTVDAQQCEARFENGVLTITLPKREEARPRTIEVKVQS